MGLHYDNTLDLALIYTILFILFPDCVEHFVEFWFLENRFSLEKNGTIVVFTLGGWRRIQPGWPLGPLPHLFRAALLFNILICLIKISFFKKTYFLEGVER